MIKPVEEKNSKDSPKASNRTWKPIGGGASSAVTLPSMPTSTPIATTPEETLPAQSGMRGLIAK